jgi:hypothetical protein
MSGMYGTIKPADINIETDVEIFYHYRPSFNSEDSDFKNFKTLPTSVLTPCNVGDSTTTAISGLFNIKLPLDRFGKKGIYTIYIRPKEISARILDIGTLAAFPDVRGVVLNSSDALSVFKTGNALVGYRIEYLNDEGKKNGDFKIITSSNLCEPMSYMLNNSSEKGTKYRYTMSGRQLFCTVTPSLAPTFKPNDLPLIGASGQDIKLVNTKFNPVMLELELVEHDEETLSYMLEGDQLVDKDRALITTFNKNGEIYHQSEYGTYKDEYGTPLYEFKKEKENIDFNQSLDNIE